jgi:hypothetical protein
MCGLVTMEGLRAGSMGKPLASRELGTFVFVPSCCRPQNSACLLYPAFSSISMAFIKIPPLNCIVTTGDFLLARRTADCLCPSVCIMQEVVSPEDVRVSWWLTLEEMESQGIVDLQPPVSGDAFTSFGLVAVPNIIVFLLHAERFGQIGLQDSMRYSFFESSLPPLLATLLSIFC